MVRREDYVEGSGVRASKWVLTHECTGGDVSSRGEMLVFESKLKGSLCKLRGKVGSALVDDSAGMEGMVTTARIEAFACERKAAGMLAS